MPFDLSRKSAVVTGAASGIGLAISEALAAAGATVHMLDLDRAAAEGAASNLAKKLRIPGSRCVAHVCDVTNEQEVDACFGRICAGPSRIDILVPNAGIGSVGTVLQTTGEEMDKLYKVNIRGVFHTLKSGVKRMVADGKGGAICNLASIVSLKALADRFACAPERAVEPAASRSPQHLGLELTRSAVPAQTA
jgi:NAD(P)-dependent dehydrogenase (short-subunit alcohol dehydrogenase family)